MKSHNLISKSGYRFTAQHCTNINNNVWPFLPPPSQKKNTIQATEFKKYTYKEKNK